MYRQNTEPHVRQARTTRWSQSKRKNPTSPRGKPPLFTTDSRGYLQNPLSESGTSWWHITSPYVVDIERDGFHSPAFFASELDDLCWMYVELGRSYDPVTLYEVRLRLDPKNLLCPQTLFADWLKSWEVLRQATNTRRTDIPDGVTYVSTFGPFDANDDVIRWFESAQFFDTLTALGKSFYTEVVVPLSSEKEYPLSIAETLAGVCVCDWNTLHKMRRYPRYNAWFAQNGIRGWIEIESFYWNEWVLDAAGRWHPRDGGFNIGVFDTRSIEIVEVLPDIHDCYDEEDETPLSEVIGRKNPGLSGIVHTYKLWRGVPYSGLDLDDLQGRGGYGHQMLGGGLYTTDEYYVAEGYAHPERGRYRDSEREDKPCVYELELAIPENQIYRLNAYDMSFCRAEGSSAIPQIFGVQSPAFEMTIKDRSTGEEIVYLISETRDPLEYAKDFKLECANEILDFYGLGTMGRYVDFDEYLEDEFYNCEDDDYEDDRHKEACEAFLAYVDEHAGGDVSFAIDSIQNLIDEKIREECGLPNYGKYDDPPYNVIWGGDSTELAGIAATHGYKVLWCSEWVASGDEIVIVDDSIYDNGLTIVDDCT